MQGDCITYFDLVVFIFVTFIFQCQCKIQTESILHSSHGIQKKTKTRKLQKEIKERKALREREREGERERETSTHSLLKSWSCSHINCKIPTSNPTPSCIPPPPSSCLWVSFVRQVTQNLNQNPDKLSPGPSSLEQYIENLFQTLQGMEENIFIRIHSFSFLKNKAIYT